MEYVVNDAIKLMICCHVATLDELLLLWVCTTTQKYVWRKKIKAQGFEIIG